MERELREEQMAAGVVATAAGERTDRQTAAVDAPGRSLETRAPAVLEVKVKARVRRPGEQLASTTLTLRMAVGDTLELALAVKATGDSG